MICHRRAGKTTACLMDMLRSATKIAGGRFAYIAPLRNQAKTVAWDMLKSFARPVLKGGPNEAELRVDLLNGARITLFGADNPDALRGQAFDGVVLDEYADMPPSLFPVIVRPALTDRKGFCVVVGTVKGRNQLWQTYEVAKNDPQNWYTAYLKASETHLIDEQELADARRQMAPEQYDSEFECDPYAAILGAYYGKQMADAERENRVCSVQHDPGVPVHTAWDLGMHDSMAIWFWQAVGREVHVIDYYEDHGKGFDHYAAVLRSRPYVYGKDFVPHDAKVKELGPGKSRVESLFALGRRPELVLNHKRDDGISEVRKIFHKCWFDAGKCADGLEALRQYRTDYDEKLRIFKDEPKHDWASHPADAFRYLAMAYKEMAAAEPPPKPQGIFIPLEDMDYDEYEKYGRRQKQERA